MNANELRIGNWVMYKGNPKQVDYNHIGAAYEGSNYYTSISLTPEILEQCGFKLLDHFTVAKNMRIDVGRNRVLSVGCVGTPNEMVFLSEENENTVKDLICLRNYDYDGYTHLHQLQNLYFSLTNTELQWNRKK